jgi:hypothetical protein
MKFDAPQGSVFGGYGFLNYSGRPASGPSGAHRTSIAVANTRAFSLRSLLRSTSEFLGRFTGR